MAITYHAGRRVQGLEYTAGSTATYETDFSTDTDWIGGDGKNEVDTSTERLDFDIRRDGSNDKIYYDLGSALSDTAWVIRFKLVMTAKSYTSGSGIVGFVGMSSVTGDALTTQDFLGLRKHITDIDSSAVINNTIVSDGVGYNLGNPTSGTQYHELRRTSATEFINTVWGSDTYSGTPIATDTLTISSGIIGLRYFNITNYDSGSGSGTMTGYIDDLEIYDGITSVVASTGDTKPTNVQVGSRYEETDTRKMYHKIDVTGADVSLTELKAYWKFDEPSGDIINEAEAVGSTDSLDTDADLQVTGATYNNTNTPFNTMNFDGTNDVAKAGTSTSQFNFMHNGGKFTVSMWVSIDNITDEGYLISDITGANTNGFGFTQTATSRWLFRIFDSGIWVDQYMGSGHGMTAGTFYFLTFTWDPTESTDKATFYRDGVEIATANQSTSQGSSSNANSVVGVGAQGSNAGWLGCEIAEMAIWNRVLTDAEITSLYNSGSGKEINSDVWKEEGT